MTRYIVEIDTTSGSRIPSDNGYAYSINLYATVKSANRMAMELMAQYGTDNIYLVSVYEVKFVKGRPTEGKGKRVSVYRNLDCRNTVADEYPNTLSFYTRIGYDGHTIIGVQFGKSREWDTESNIAIR